LLIEGAPPDQGKDAFGIFVITGAHPDENL